MSELTKEEVMNIIDEHLTDEMVANQDVDVSRLNEDNFYLICFDGYKFGSEEGRIAFMSEMNQKLKANNIDALVCPINNTKVFELGNSSNIEVVD